MRLTGYRFLQNCHKATLAASINNQEYVTNIYNNKITERKEFTLRYLIVRVEESDEQTFESDVQFLDVILENDIDLLPYITRNRDHSQIDIIKDKLINSKRLFDSPSITNKLNLSNEYENLSENLSNEINNTTADERKLLEQRLNEIIIRSETKRNLCLLRLF
ncbi:unnamed protein product [Rotaria sp. Silwood1]|nr:unnamed protein product [Rotaria sp. Silwood1]